MQESIALVISLVVLLYVLLPFFTGKGGKLASASTINDPDKLRGLKKAILERFLIEERACKEGDISSVQWEKRSRILTNRYIDISKRLDFVDGYSESTTKKEEV